MANLNPVAGQDGLQGKHAVIGATTDVTGDVLDISDYRQPTKSNRGRTIQLKATTNGGTRSATGTLKLYGRIDPTDDDAWVECQQELDATVIETTISPEPGGIVVGAGCLAYDYRELRLDLAGVANCDSVDFSLFVAS